MERHYGMDWLRIGAIGILILYHIGMVFVPWGFHVKTAAPADWVAVPMLLPNAWRMTLLFVVSGYASRALLSRQPEPGPFIARRSGRLLVPLVFGMAVIVPPQSWIELVLNHGYDHGYTWFWLHVYFRFDTFYGIKLPTWNHLWFLAYLWVYTLVLALFLPLGSSKAQELFDRVFGGWRALVLPIPWLLFWRVLVFLRGEETHDLFGDGIAHLAYFPAFLFGFALAGSPPVMAALTARWRVSLVLALASYALVALAEAIWPGNTVAPDWAYAIFRPAREVQTWASIAALIGIAERYWNRDHHWRKTLTEGVYPFYIVHQTAIIVVAGAILGLGLGPVTEFVVLLVATVAACWIFYLAGRELGPLRVLIGLRAKRKSAVQTGS